MNATSVRPAPPPINSWRHRTLCEFLGVSVEKGAYEVLLRLEQDPLTPVDGEAGALLMAACVVDPMSWASEPDWLARFAAIRNAARHKRSLLPADITDTLMDELDAADEVFAGNEAA